MATVLFVCLHNAGRSQMSQALFERAAAVRHKALSAGTTPAEHMHPEVVAVMRELDIDPARLNVNGGACALGHPIGASGARILATLLAALEARGAKRGLASLCIGGGEAVAMAVERL